MGSPPPEIEGGGGASVERLAVAEVLVAEAQDQPEVAASRDLLLAARLVVPHVLLGAAALHHCKNNETGETVSVWTPPCVCLTLCPVDLEAGVSAVSVGKMFVGRVAWYLYQKVHLSNKSTNNTTTLSLLT